MEGKEGRKEGISREQTSGESPHRPEAVHCLQGLKKGLFPAKLALSISMHLGWGSNEM